MKTCVQKAYELLGRRAHFRRELQAKLDQRGYDEAEIEATLDRLQESGEIDDEATAELWIESRLRRAPEGPQRLRAELQRRGADRELALRAVESVVGDREPELARSAAERWHARHPQGDRRALARHLERRGFRAGLVAALLDGGSAAATGVE